MPDSARGGPSGGIHPLVVKLVNLATGEGAEARPREILALSLEVLAIPGLGDRERAAGHNFCGYALSLLGDTAEALEQYYEAARRDPENPLVLQSLGALLAKLRLYDQALPVLMKGVELDPTSADSWAYLAIVHMTHRDKGRGRRAAARALTLDPDNIEANRAMGLVMAVLGNHEEAISCLQKACAQAPHDVSLHVDLAFATHHAGRFEESMAAFAAALSKDPNALDGDEEAQAVYRGSRERRHVT